jgi:hypothetical protein
MRMSEPVDPTREATGEVIYQEALRLRSMQEARVNDIRSRSSAILPASSALVVLAAALGRQSLGGWVAGFAIAALVAGAIAALLVQRPTGAAWVEGPDVEELAKVQFEDGASLAQVRRDVALYHYRTYVSNEDGPLKQMHMAFMAELAFLTVAICLILGGVST